MINAVFMQEPQRLRANRLLPNNLTIENIKAGNSNMRNPILASFAAKLLPYRGLVAVCCAPCGPGRRLN